MYDAVYIGNSHQTFKIIMDSHFFKLLHILKNGQKLDSFDDYFDSTLNLISPIQNYVSARSSD